MSGGGGDVWCINIAMFVLGVVALSFCSFAAAELTNNGFSKTKRSAPITFPLKRRGNDRSPREIYEADIARILGLYGSNDDNSERKEKRLLTIPLSNLNEDTGYYATLQIGTPPQNMDFLADSGSSDLWVYTNDCSSCKPTSPLPLSDGTKQYFNKSRSTTIAMTNTPVSITYAGGSNVAGVVARETVAIGGFAVPNQTFIYVTSQESTQGGPALLGLGWAPNAVTNSTPWWQNAIAQFESPEFSFLFSQWNGTVLGETAHGGQFTLGGRNHSVYDGNVSFIPIKSDKYWDVPLTRINVTPTYNVTITPNLTIVDSGTSLLYGPEDSITAFYAGVEGAVRGETVNNNTLAGLWIIPCNTAVNPEFILGNVTITIPAAAIRLPETISRTFKNVPGGLNTTYCVGGLATVQVPNRPSLWVLGLTFLKGVYTVFRKGAEGEAPSVGFARIKGVDYAGNGTVILEWDGNGIDGSIGITGPNGTTIEVNSTATSSPVEDNSTATSSPVITSDGGGRSSAAGRTLHSFLLPIVKIICIAHVIQGLDLYTLL